MLTLSSTTLYAMHQPIHPLNGEYRTRRERSLIRVSHPLHQENHKAVAGRDCMAECGRSDGSGATPP